MKCNSCGFPYATVEKCQNCGNTNPGGCQVFFFQLIGGLIMIVFLYIMAKACS